MTRWPSFIQMNVYGFDDFFFGDADGDGVMDRLPPNSLSTSFCLPILTSGSSLSDLARSQPRTTST